MQLNKLIIFIVLFVLSTSSFSQGKKKEEEKKESKVTASLHITKVDAGSSDVDIDMQVQNASSEPVSFEAFTSDENQLSVSYKKMPVNLWILLDSSALCKYLKFDEYTKKLIPMLKENLHKDSIISIFSYRSKKQYHFYNHSNLKDLKLLNFECVPNARSVSYGEALGQLLKQKESVSLPTVVWAYSSGNARITNTIAEQVKKRDISIHLIFYNDRLKFQLNKVNENSKKQLGTDLFSSMLSSPKDLEGVVPSSFYKLEVSVPRSMHGSNLNVKIVAKKGEGDEGEPVGETFTSILVEKSKIHDLVNWLIYVGYAFGVFLVFYFFYRIIKYYMPQKCKNCGQFMRQSDEYCLNCEKGINGYLVVKSLVDNQAKDQVLAIGNKKIKIGTNSSSKIKLNKTQNGEAIVYCTVKTDMLRLAGRTFKITPNTFMENVNVKLNGTFLSCEKYLSSGDVIDVPGYQISLFYEKENNHE